MTTDDLLAQMSALLWFDGLWHARARGSSVYFSAPVARDAMLLALGLGADLF